MSRKQAVRARWRGRVEEQLASGLSAVAWCAEHDVNLKSFYRWRSRLRHEMALEPGTEIEGGEGAGIGPTAFARVDVVQPVLETRALQVRAGQRTVVIEGDFDEAVLGRLVQLLERLP